MSSGIDKLILLCMFISELFLRLAREQGVRKWGYNHVIDLRQTDHKLPIILYCDGMRDGRHKLEVVGVGRIGQDHTLKILKKVIGHLSDARIYRIDFCVDLPGVSVWDMAEVALVSRNQNFKIYNNRGGATFYLQNSAHKTILLYDKIKQLAAKGDHLADTFRPDEHLTRIEVQLKGRGVPFKKIRHLHRYADIDLLGQVHLRRLKRLRDDAKPLHHLAAAGLRRLIYKYGLHAAKKRFSPSHWAYIEKTLFRVLEGEDIPNIRRRLKRRIEDWLEDRIRFPSPLFARASTHHERD